MEALDTAGTLALTSVVAVWALWLASQSGASRRWKLLSAGVIPCVGAPLALSGVLSDASLVHLAHGTLLFFAVLVSVGTLTHTAQSLEKSD